MIVGGLMLHSFLNPPPPPSAGPARPLRTITLYFAAPDGGGLVAESREIDDCPHPEACLAATVEALRAGPVGKLAPILPAATELRGVGVAGSEVQLDFTRTLVDGHPGGSLGELLTVYGLVDTVAVNFPQLRQVRILVEGQAVDTLKGHIDLRQPLVPDFGLIVNPSAGSSVPAPAGRSL
jgi:spore germination protein GerM